MRNVLFSAAIALFVGLSTLAIGADEECNRIILTKRNDVVALNNCDIGIFKKQIESMEPSRKLAELLASNGESMPLSIYNDRMGFFKETIKNRQDINQAVADSVIGRKEAMEIRFTLMEREGKYFNSMEERKEKYRLRLEKSSSNLPAHQPIVIQQPSSAPPDAFAKPPPTSMVCQKTNIFGVVEEVRCDFK